MVNSGRGMTTERAIPDLWEVFGSRGSNGSGGGGLGIRRNSWQKMQAQLSEEERAVTELFNDLHLQLESPGDHSPDPKKNSTRYVIAFLSSVNGRELPFLFFFLHHDAPVSVKSRQRLTTNVTAVMLVMAAAVAATTISNTLKNTCQ